LQIPKAARKSKNFAANSGKILQIRQAASSAYIAYVFNLLHE
jgi:hypothetical protein